MKPIVDICLEYVTDGRSVIVPVYRIYSAVMPATIDTVTRQINSIHISRVLSNTHTVLQYPTMERLFALHSRLQFTITLVIVVSLIWALIVAWCNRGSMQAPLGILQLLIIAQSVIGLLLLWQADLFRMALHVIYGVVAVGLMPATAVALRRRSPREVGLICAGILVMLLIVVGRLYETGVGSF